MSRSQRSSRSVSTTMGGYKNLLNLSVTNYYDFEYYKSPKNFVESLQGTPNKLPKHYRKNLLMKIQQQYEKFENSLQKRQQMQLQQRRQVNDFEELRESKLNFMQNMMSRTTDLKNQRIDNKIKKISEHHTHVNETKEKYDEEMRERKMLNEKNIKSYQEDLNSYLDTKEKSCFLTSAIVNVSQIQERENQKKLKYESQLDEYNKKNSQLSDKIDQHTQKRTQELAKRIQKASQVGQQIEQNQATHQKLSAKQQNDMITKMAGKLEKITMTNIIKEKANLIVIQNQKEEQMRKDEIISENKSKLRDTYNNKVKILNDKFNSPPKIQRSPSKINVDDQIIKVLTNYDKIRHQQELKNQQLLQNHLEYTTNNKILKFSYDKLNDYKRRAYFLQKQDDI